MDPGNLFWNVSYLEASDAQAAVFINLLLATTFGDEPHLAMEFANKNPTLLFLKRPLHIQWRHVDIQDYFHCRQMGIHEMTMSPPELVAQLMWNQYGTFNFILNLISKLDLTDNECSALLLSYIGWNDHHFCKKF